MQKPQRSRPLTLLLLAGALLSAVPAVTLAADAEVVVAMRYPQEAGESHAHLFLYRRDGKLLRQLTADESGQDRHPAFAPNGETIVFTREKGESDKEFWSIEPRGSNLRRLDAAPDWYTKTSTSAHFTDLGDVVQSDDPPSYEAPDGSVEVILATSGSRKADQPEHEELGWNYQLKDLKTGKSTAMGRLPGFVGLQSALGCLADDQGYYLITPPLRVMFFDLHLNSTDGTTVFALDLKTRKLVRLSPNGTIPVMLPGEPAFLTLTEVRYVPFGKGQRTSNSSYVERWDASLKKVRYANGEKAGICYGGAMYRPGMKPATITIRDGTWKDADAPVEN